MTGHAGTSAAENVIYASAPSLLLFVYLATHNLRAAYSIQAPKASIIFEFLSLVVPMVLGMLPLTLPHTAVCVLAVAAAAMLFSPSGSAQSPLDDRTRGDQSLA